MKTDTRLRGCGEYVGGDEHDMCDVTHHLHRMGFIDDICQIQPLHAMYESEHIAMVLRSNNPLKRNIDEDVAPMRDSYWHSTKDEGMMCLGERNRCFKRLYNHNG